MLSGPAAEVLFVRQIELKLTGECAQLRCIEVHVEQIARRAGGQVGEGRHVGAEDTQRIRDCRNRVQGQARAVRSGQVLNLELQALRAATYLECAEVQVQRAAAVGKAKGPLLLLPLNEASTVGVARAKSALCSPWTLCRFCSSMRLGEHALKGQQVPYSGRVATIDGSRGFQPTVGYPRKLLASRSDA